ncbi:hypothetical protein WJX81_008466 [Elliptochloris bilobata]|uniref:DNA helicase n=1 Tax=Elliptochloris bilobata TaxID=381761 RepID=A0AAW1RKY8_9CHLO
MPSDAALKRNAKNKERQKRALEPPAKLKASVQDAPTVSILFPTALTPRQRALLHEVAEGNSVAHASAGEGAERRIRLGEAAASTAVEVPDGALSDDAVPHTAAGAAPSPSQRGARNLGAGEEGGPSRALAVPPAARAPTLEAFVARTLPLIEMEREAEVVQALESSAAARPEAAAASGRTLLNLRVRDAEGGLLGRTLLTLVSNKGGGSIVAPLPAHRLSTHDLVALRPAKGGGADAPLASGVVYRVREDSLTVALEEAPDEAIDQPLRLDKLANEVTYRRLRETLTALGRAATAGGPAAPLLDVLFGAAAPRFQEAPVPWTPRIPRLDHSQRAAVSRALAAKDIALVHGPPGTGKTTTVVEIILQEVARGSKVLATAASNIAVDNLVERLVAADPKLKLVRTGHAARLLPSVLAASLEAQVLASDSSALARDCRREMKAATVRLLKLGRKDYAERRALRSELRTLAKEERSRQQKAIAEVLGRAAVVCATLTGTLSYELRDVAFDVAVVDEAAQALEAATWGALLKAPRAVLAGDHLQLPPTVISDAAARQGLAETLFERLQALHGGVASEMLAVQYRMHGDVMAWASHELYDDRLTAADAVAAHTLADLPDVDPRLAGELGVLALIDTAGCGMEEAAEEGSESRANPGEARAALAHVRRLLAAGVRPADIGVITPYNAQVALLREMRGEALAAVEISSVDGFQGREKEAIVISMVRCNAEGTIGFLSDRRRMNVAVTRARRHCALVCDSETVGRDAFLGRLLAHFEAHGEYSSAAELVGD